MRKLKNILVTGGAGFIGSNFIRCLFGMSASGKSEFNFAQFNGIVVNLDALTYAGNLENLADVEKAFGRDCATPRYFFERGDICDRKNVERIFREYDIDTVVHFAAESHVDRSVLEPEAFVRTNVLGTYTLLDVAKNYWKCSLDNVRDDVLFHHISTDEVYGSLGDTGYFTESTPYDPRSPYSASKASSDHIAMAYSHTFALPLSADELFDIRMALEARISEDEEDAKRASADIVKYADDPSGEKFLEARNAYHIAQHDAEVIRELLVRVMAAQSAGQSQAA